MKPILVCYQPGDAHRRANLLATHLLHSLGSQLVEIVTTAQARMLLSAVDSCNLLVLIIGNELAISLNNECDGKLQSDFATPHPVLYAVRRARLTGASRLIATVSGAQIPDMGRLFSKSIQIGISTWDEDCARLAETIQATLLADELRGAIAIPKERKPAPSDQNKAVLWEVFPHIETEDSHTIVGSVVNFLVTLSAQKAATTAGRVLLPDTLPHAKLTLKVHLMFGAHSAWDTLTYSIANGTIKAASFKLPAPAVNGERELVGVRVNFYLNQRWCGEGQRNLDVLRDIGVSPLDTVPMPTIPPWRRGLVLQPDALPPDLIVRIQKGVSPGEFIWSCLSPHLDLPDPAKEQDARMSFGEDAATFVRKTFAPLASKPLGRLDVADVGGAGEKIYRSAPQHFRDCYWAVWHAAVSGGFSFESIQLVTDEPCVPWELMRIWDKDRAPGVDAEFLGIRHSVGRWLATESGPMHQRIPVRQVAVSASDYHDITAVGSKLPWAAKERDLMVQSYEADEIPLKSGSLLDFLEHGKVQAMHFACHGKMSIVDPDASVLVMEDTPSDLKPLAIARSEVCNGIGSQHPLIFLNACEVGGTAASLSLIAGFPAAFLYAGAAALVSPLWAINDELAHRIAEDFYREAFVPGSGKPLGIVLRELRARWKDEKQLTYLAYVLYGDPLASVDYKAV